MIPKFSLYIVVVMMTAPLAQAQESTAAKLTTQTRKVVVFKDGFALFTKDASGKPDASGQIVLATVPKGVSLGSFWVVPQNAILQSIVARQWLLLQQGKQEMQRSMLLRFDPKSIAETVDLQINYFGPGIRWIPTYRVMLSEDAADLSMQAELLNEAEDLENADIHLVVGVPNFQFKDTPSPMSFETSLMNPLNTTAPALMGQMSNVMGYKDRAGEKKTEGLGEPSPGMPNLPPQLTGEEAQDLFVYQLPRMTLRTGERAIVPITAARVPLKHVYTWDLTLGRSGAENLSAEKHMVSIAKEARNEIWHKVELENGTQVPWTTGPAFVMEGGLPVAQELIKYTPIKGHFRLPLTVASDVIGSFTEKETGRAQGAVTLNTVHYARVSKTGTLKIVNYKAKPVIVFVTFDLPGNASEASDQGEIVLSDYRVDEWASVRSNPALNGHSTIRWTVELEPGQTRLLTADYAYYVN